MKIKNCGHNNYTVFNSRPREFMGYVSVYRRRKCIDCGEKISTIEIPMEYAQEMEIKLKFVDQTLEGLNRVLCGEGVDAILS